MGHRDGSGDPTNSSRHAQPNECPPLKLRRSPRCRGHCTHLHNPRKTKTWPVRVTAEAAHEMGDGQLRRRLHHLLCPSEQSNLDNEACWRQPKSGVDGRLGSQTTEGDPKSARAARGYGRSRPKRCPSGRSLTLRCMWCCYGRRAAEEGSSSSSSSGVLCLLGSSPPFPCP